MLIFPVLLFCQISVKLFYCLHIAMLQQQSQQNVDLTVLLVSLNVSQCH